MSIFQDSTPVTESPEQGHEEVAAEAETQATEQEQEIETAATEETTTETVEETPSETEHGDELLAGKYKSVDDLVKGYKNLEKTFHDSRQKPQEQQPPAQQPQFEQQYQESPQEMVIRMLNDDPIGTINYFAQQAVQQATAPIMAEREQAQLTRNFESITKEYRESIKSDEDVQSLFGKVQEIADELGKPEIARNPSPRVLKMAAMEIWGDSKASLYEKAKQAGREEAEATRRAKQGLSAASATKPTETPKTEEQRIREAIVGSGPRGFFS